MKMIILITKDNLSVQFNDESYKLETFNLSFQHGIYASFSFPCIWDNYQFSFDSRIVETIKNIDRTLTKIASNPDINTVPEVVAALVKRYKVKFYQINVKSNFDDSNLKPYSVNCLIEMSDTIKNMGKIAA